MKSGYNVIANGLYAEGSDDKITTSDKLAEAIKAGKKYTKLEKAMAQSRYLIK